MRPPALLALLLATVAGCAAAPPERVKQGESLLAAGDAEGARSAFEEVIDDDRSSPLDLKRAQVGAARAFLARGDLVGARARLRRLADTVPDKWFYLGEIARRERDLPEAERCYRAALERAHGPEAARRLAEVLAAEARAADALEEAVVALVRGGERELAEAAGAALGVWRQVGTVEPAAAAATLDGLPEEVRAWPSVRVLRARLLDRAGRADEAAKAWDLASAAPPPSPAFQAWAAGLRAKLALERGDRAGLDAILDKADPTTAAAVRARIARERTRRGDLEGALDLWRRVAQAGGPASPGWAEVAWHEEALGLPGAATSWAKAEAGRPDDPGARLRLALHRAQDGDLLGARTLLRATQELLPGPGAQAAPPPEPRPPPSRGALREELAPARRQLEDGAALLERALAALVQGDDAVAAARARALAALHPGGASGRAIGAALAAGSVAERVSRLVGAKGETQAALDRCRLALALRADDLPLAARLLAAGLDASAPDVQRELEAAVLRALRDGRAAEAGKFLEGHAGAVSAAARARLRAADTGRALPEAALPGPRGVAALDGVGAARGELLAPPGQRLPRAEVRVRAGARGARTVLLPDGGRADEAPGWPAAALELGPDPALDDEAWAELGRRTRGETRPPGPVPVLP